MEVKLETERFILREVLLTDVDAFFELDSNPEVQKYVGNSPVVTKSEIINRIENLQKQYAANGIARWAVIEKESDAFVGWAGFKWITEPINNQLHFYELGYRFLETHWGKGIATETSRALIAYAFANLTTDSLYAICDCENLNSRKVLEKVGFQWKEVFMHDGIPHHWFYIHNN